MGTSLSVAHAAKPQHIPWGLVPLSHMSFFLSPEDLSGMLDLGGLCSLITESATDAVSITVEANWSTHAYLSSGVGTTKVR